MPRPKVGLPPLSGRTADTAVGGSGGQPGTPRDGGVSGARCCPAPVRQPSSTIPGKRGARVWLWWLVLGCALQGSLSGCGRKGAPQPFWPQAPSAYYLAHGEVAVVG